MQFPKLTQLQSRFAACLGASATILIIYFILSSPRFADALELEAPDTGGEVVRVGADDNWHRIRNEETGSSDRTNDALSDGEDETWLEELDIRSDYEPALQTDEVENSEIPAHVERAATSTTATVTGTTKASATTSTTSTPAATPLTGSNEAVNLNIEAGEEQDWVVQNISSWTAKSPAPKGLPSMFGNANVSSLYLEVNGSTQVFVTINTCLQPHWNGTGAQSASPPQLTLYVSASGNSQSVELDQGFANVTLFASGKVDISVAAPAMPENFSGGWNYELAASVDNYFHGLGQAPAPPFYWVDSDTSSALMVTANLTLGPPQSAVYQEWMEAANPFIVYGQNQEYISSIDGVMNSFCGLQNNPVDIMASQSDPEGITIANVQMGMIDRSSKPQQQFYIKGLNGTSSYSVILAMPGNSTASGSGVVGGGGHVWQPRVISTKSDGNCALLYNLTFCSEVAYAVPNNPYTVPSFEELQHLYDDYAYALYQNFSYSLNLMPCNTTSTAQYSLAKNCDDCATAYKQWLCTVTIPRCDDYTSDNIWLYRRNVGQPFFQNNTMLPEAQLQLNWNPMLDAPGDSAAKSQVLITNFATNQSRNPTLIDYTIMPGPYKELLVCEDYCHNLVASCPAALGFSCPYPGQGLEAGYSPRDSSAPGNLSCSFLGAAYDLSSASTFQISTWGLCLSVATTIYLLWS